MKRLMLVSLASAALSASAMAADCAKDYKDFWENFDRARFAKMSAEQIANLSRTALRAYDTCQAGDEQGAKVLFAKLPDWDREGGPGPVNPNLPR
jgi:hypothetical protein